MCFFYSREFQEKDLCDTISRQILNVIYSLKMLQFQSHFLIEPFSVTTYTRKHIFHVFEAFKIDKFLDYIYKIW